MSALAAEAVKLATSRPVRWLSLAGVGLPLLLTWYNGSTARNELDTGRFEWVTDDLGNVGSGELLLAAACLAAIGVLVVGAEHVRLPEEQGGGRQAVTTALSVPSRRRVLGAKLGIGAAWMGLVAAGAAFGSILVAHVALGPHTVGLDAARWAVGARGLVYVLLTGLLGLAVTAVLRNGLVPLVYLVGNSTVVSPGYLLTNVTPWAWYLPDTAPMTIIRIPPDPGQPTGWVVTLVAVGWVLGLLALAFALDRRRDA